MKWWSTKVVYRRKQVIGLAVLFTLLAGLWGTGVFSRLVSGGFDDVNSQSSRAEKHLVEQIGSSNADLIVLISNPDRTVDDPAYAADVNAALATIPRSDVAAVRDYFINRSSAFVTPDKHSTFVAVTLTDPETSHELSSYDPMKRALAADGYTAKIGGPSAVNDDVSARVSADIGRAESISMPILLILLVIIFGSVVSALLPLVVGGISILGAFAALRFISMFTDVSIFAVNIVTIMGLGLAIDYGLFMVGRFREELRNGYPPDEAARRSVQTAGRTVLVSAVTLMVALAGLTLFPQVFLRSMGFGGMAAVLIAALSATVVLPDILATLGTRIERLPVRLFRRRAAASAGRTTGAVSTESVSVDDAGFWYRLAHSVMRRPVVYLVASCLILVTLASPFLHVKFGGVDAKVLPSSSQARQVSETLQREFPGTDATPIIVAIDLTVPAESAAGTSTLDSYLSQLRQLPSVRSVAVTATKNTTARIDVSYSGDNLAASTKTLVRQVRALPPSVGVQQVLVGGETAKLIDRLHSIGSILPWMGLAVGGATFILLFLAFGSLVLPLKAIVLNGLSLGASFGVVTWIFGDGHLAGLLNFTPTGTVEATQPILVLAIVFGLSMDYEVFLLSRVREEFDRTGDNRAAVATGLQRTGSIITSAALLIIVVIAAFSASSITFIKLIGVAMATAIVVDAVLVRMIVVPAAMRLLGSANWWAPKPLRGIYRRYGIREQLQPIERELTDA